MLLRNGKIDLLRVFTLIIILLGIAHFYLIVIAPRLIPFYLRPGMPERPMNVLLMGTDLVFDKETHNIISESGHSDTIVLAHIDPRACKINLLSIPRDTLAEIPGYGSTKINASNIIGGTDLARATVENLLGVPVDRTAIINPSGIVKLIDLLGGIRVYVDKDMYYVDRVGKLNINLKKGWHTLSGEEANGYIRFRMDPLGDINRIQRQQGFIKALMRKLSDPMNVWRVPVVIGLAKESIKTDLSLAEIFRIGNLVRCLSREDLRMILLPGDFCDEHEKACFWIANSGETEKILRKYFSKKPNGEIEAAPKPAFYISIFNNSGDANAPYMLLKKLTKTKYAVANITYTDRDDYMRSRIIAQKGDIAGARELGRLIGIEEVVVSGSGDYVSDYTIILGRDYLKRSMILN